MRQSTGRAARDGALALRVVRVPRQALEPEPPRPITDDEIVCRSCQLVVPRHDRLPGEVSLLVCRDCYH